MALLIPVLRENYASIEKALNKFAPYDWAARGSVHLFAVDPPGCDDLDELIEYCQGNQVDHILIPKRLHCDEKALSEAGYTVTIGPGIKELVQGHALRDRLRLLGLDWRSTVLKRLANFGLGSIGEDLMDSWLAQFERLGNHRSIGEHLLQLIQVMPLAELGDSLCIDSDFYGDALVVGFNNDKWGKSWATVSNLIRKKCESAELLPITDAIQAGKHPKVLRLVEDGLFSGTEIRAIFESLRGTRPPGRAQKVPKLQDPSSLSQLPIRLHFGVVCDFGEAVLRHYAATHRLPNIQVVVSAAATTIRVLRTAPSDVEGPHGSNNGNAQTDIDELRSRVAAFAFQDDKGWKNEAEKERARRFCQSIGEQLWRAYIQKKNFDPGAWPEDRVRRCSLGMEGLGLTFAFPHSVPKATLPIFWASGRVTLDSVSLDWRPLFPNADT